jgi:hypothetical protein
MQKLSANKALGLGCVVLGVVLAFIWIPLDSDTGLVERSRGRFVVGDSLAPTLAAAFILIAGMMLVFGRSDQDDKPNCDNLRFIGAMVGFGIISLLVMRWAGPMVASFFSGGEEYRILRDTVPWKYTGFVIGGIFLVFSLICFVEERLSWRALLISIGAVVGIILLYDVPFDDVLLPPNGDV